MRYVRIAMWEDDDDYQEPWKESDYYHEDADWWKDEQPDVDSGSYIPGKNSVYSYDPNDPDFWSQRPYLQSVEHLNIDNGGDLGQWTVFAEEAWYFALEYAQIDSSQGIVSQIYQDNPDFSVPDITEELVRFSTHPATVRIVNEQLMEFEQSFYDWLHDWDQTGVAEAYYLSRNGYDGGFSTWDSLWREYWDSEEINGVPIHHFMEQFCQQQGPLHLVEDRSGLFKLSR